MKTTLDIEDILFSFLAGGSLAGEVNGSIYKRQRPAQSKLEDIVIVSLPMNNEQLQQGIVNVNIHVPNKPVVMNDITDFSHPDHARLKYLSAIAATELNENWEPGDFHFYVQQQNVFQDDTADNHYVNFRIDFFSINT